MKSINFFSIFVGLVLAFWVGPAFCQTDRWECEEPVWKKEPTLENGIFQARIGTVCRVFSKKEDGISWIFKKLQDEYQRLDKYTIHQGPVTQKLGQLTDVYYDLTDHLSEEDSDLSIRQDVHLKTDEKTKLSYVTKSKSIQASGTASYLKNVSFLTEIKSKKGFYEVALENEVKVERPWFAISFLFKPMSASITESKFEKAREKLIQYLLSENSL